MGATIIGTAQFEVLADGLYPPEPPRRVEAGGNGEARRFLLIFQPDFGVVPFGCRVGSVVVRHCRAGNQAGNGKRSELPYHLACRPRVKVRGRPGAKVSKPELTPVLSA